MTNFKKLLLTGTAVVAMGSFAPAAFAANVELDGGAAVVNDTGIDDTDVLIDAADDATDSRTVNTNGVALTLGADGAAAGINAVGAGDADASSVSFTNSTTTASTITVEDDGTDAILRADSALTINLGTDGSTDATGATNMIVSGNINTTTTGIVNFVLDGFDGNTLTLVGDADLGDDGATTVGTITLTDASDTLIVGLDADVGTTVTGDILGAGVVDLSGDDAGSSGATIAGNVGTSDQSLAEIIIGNDNTDSATGTDAATIQGNLYADTVTFEATTVAGGTTNGGTLNLTGTAAGSTVMLGFVTTAVDNDGILNVIPAGANDVNMTVTGNIGASDAALGSVNLGNNGSAGDSSLTAGGDLYAGIVTLAEDSDGRDSTITFTGGSSDTAAMIVANIEGAGAGEGDVVVADGANVTFANAIGGGTRINEFDVATGATVNISNDILIDFDSAEDDDDVATVVVADQVDPAGFDINGTLNVDTSGAAVEIDDATGIMALDGTVNVDGTNGLTLGSAGTIHAGWNDVAAKLVTNDTVTLSDNFLVGNSAEDRYTINLSSAAGTVNGGGNDLVIDASGSKLNLGLTSDAAIDSGDTVTWLTGFSVASDLDGELAAEDIVLNFNNLIVADTTGSSDTEITADLTFQDASDAGFDRNTAGFVDAVLSGLDTDTDADTAAATAADTAFVTANPGLDADDPRRTALTDLRNALISAPTNAQARDIAEAAGPIVDGGAQVTATTGVVNSSLGITGERMAAVRSGDTTGMAAGNMTHGLKVWGKVFGTTGEQDDRDGVTGFDIDTVGGTVGVDTQTLVEDWTWGLALTYANTDLDKNIGSVGSVDTDVDTYQAIIYGDYKWDAMTYMNVQLGYAMNNGEQERTALGLTADADVDSDVYFARLETGRDFDMDNGFSLTPIAMLNYMHIDLDDYNESGAGAANLNVDYDNMNILELGLGGEASYLMQNADGSFLKPKLHAAYRYDVIGDEVEGSGSVAGAAFDTEGFDAQQSTFNVGAGLEFYSTSNWDMSINYDYEIKEDYDGHNGYVRAAYKF